MPRSRDPVVEASKIASAAAFFVNIVTKMNGCPPTDEQIKVGARKIAAGMPPFWDSRTKKYLS